MSFVLFSLACAPNNPTSPTAGGWDAGSAGFDTAGFDTADPRRLDDAQIISATFPLSLECGQSGEALVTVRNTGTSTWTANEGYRLGAVGDQDDLNTEGRILLDADERVVPGAEHTFAVALRAPNAAGNPVSDWQMLREGVQWFGAATSQGVTVTCADEEPVVLPLPDMYWLVEEVHSADPSMISRSCQDTGGTWEFMDTVVDALRAHDPRWGYNWKRAQVGDPSLDCVAYHWGEGESEGSMDVYVIDIITAHCGDAPQPGWIDVTLPVEDGGAGAMWTGRGRF